MAHLTDRSIGYRVTLPDMPGIGQGLKLKMVRLAKVDSPIEALLDEHIGEPHGGCSH
jgi:hypothetical protein